MKVARGVAGTCLLLAALVDGGGLASGQETDAQEGEAAEPLPVDVEPGAAGDPPPFAVALTLSGAASVGSYEAGWLYAMIETAKRHPEIVDVRLITGTSAGGINGLLAVLASCGDPSPLPMESPFWRTWIPIGFDALYRPEETTARAAFSSGALRDAAEAIGQEWAAGLPEGCDIVLGVTATRVEPRDVSLAGDLITVPRTEEKFVARVRGRGRWRPPLVENYAPSNPGVSVPLLPFGEPGEAFPLLRDLVLASAAYPIAFEPVVLPHCLYDGNGPPTCAGEDAEEAGFLDGGFFDNRPVRMAVNVASSGLRRDPASADRLAWSDSPVVSPRDVPDPLLFLVLDPWAYAFPDLSEESTVGTDRSLFGLVSQTFSGFVEASRAKEIQTVIEERPSVRGRIVPSRTMFPTASSPLGAFLGFFERGFREFDFFLGMHDAFAQLRRARPRLEATGYDPATIGEPFASEDGGGGWRRFDCVGAALEGRGDVARACAGPDLRALRILTQVAIERLYERCTHAAERTPPVPPPADNPICQDAQRGGAPARVVPLPDGGDPRWRRLRGEGELGHMLRRLAAYDFAFEDLGLAPDQASRAPAKIRLRLEAVLDSLARQQGVDGVLVDAVGSALLNELAYVPAASLGHALLGNAIEVGWSGTAPEGPLPWLRASVALQIDGFVTLLSSIPSYFGLAPLAGFEVELLPLSNGTWQPRLGARAGYLFSTADGFLTGDCDAEERRSTETPCSRFRTQAYVAASFWGVLRVQVGASVDPPLRSGERTTWEITPSLGLQF